jgi:hypothetical protein
LIQVTITPALSDDELSQRLIATVDGRRNTEGERIQVSDQGSIGATVQTGTTSVSLKISPVSEFYLNDDADMR